MQISAGFVALSALFLSVLATPANYGDDTYAPPQGDAPPNGKVYIKGLNYAGSGCPAGSVAGTLSTDASNLNIAFDNYIASVGKGISITQSRKNCQLTIQLVYPPGWSYSVFETQYVGYVSLDKKVVATQKSQYWFAGDQKSMTFQSKWKGPFEDDYTFTDTIEKKAVVWSPCKSAPSSLLINTQIRVDNTYNKMGEGLISTDFINHQVTHKLGCRWKKCKVNSYA